VTVAGPRARLAMSILAALLAGGMTWRALSAARSDPSRGPMAQVLFVRKSLPAGRAVTADTVERRTIPAPYAEPGALRDAREASGARARISLTKGEQLTRSKLESEASRLGLSWSLPSGATALSLRLAAEAAVGGHVLPGDAVTVLAAPARDAPFRTVVGRARVVAVQDRVWDPAGAPPSPPAGVFANDSFFVTLLLTPEQAVRVAGAAERGRLTLALLSPLDDAAAAGANAR
jgi:Flp pilus assembly protein CpaB